jgi:hypothetical protein
VHHGKESGDVRQPLGSLWNNLVGKLMVSRLLVGRNQQSTYGINKQIFLGKDESNNAAQNENRVDYYFSNRCHLLTIL